MKLVVEAKELQRGVLASYSTADVVEKYTQRIAEGLRKYEKAASPSWENPGTMSSSALVGSPDESQKR